MDRQKVCKFLCVLGIVVYFITSVIYLFDEYDEWFNCKEKSNLWVYVLVSLILIGNKRTLIWEKDAALHIIIYCGLIELGLATWGGFELFNKAAACSGLKDSGLYSVGMVSFLLQLLTGVFPFIVLMSNSINNHLTNFF